MIWESVQDFSMAEIVVDEVEFASADLWTVVDSIAHFARAAADFGGVNTQEMPPEVLWSSQATYYQTQVSRNGHFYFVCNSGWQHANIQACRKGIAECEAVDYLDIFDDLVALVENSGIQGEDWKERRAELLAQKSIKDRIDALDARYFALGEEGLLRVGFESHSERAKRRNMSMAAAA